MGNAHETCRSAPSLDLVAWHSRWSRSGKVRRLVFSNKKINFCTYHKRRERQQSAMFASNQLRVVEQIWMVDNILEAICGGSRKVRPIDRCTVCNRWSGRGCLGDIGAVGCGGGGGVGWCFMVSTSKNRRRQYRSRTSAQCTCIASVVGGRRQRVGALNAVKCQQVVVQDRFRYGVWFYLMLIWLQQILERHLLTRAVIVAKLGEQINRLAISDSRQLSTARDVPCLALVGVAQMIHMIMMMLVVVVIVSLRVDRQRRKDRYWTSGLRGDKDDLLVFKYIWILVHTTAYIVHLTCATI